MGRRQLSALVCLLGWFMAVMSGWGDSSLTLGPLHVATDGAERPKHHHAT